MTTKPSETAAPAATEPRTAMTVYADLQAALAAPYPDIPAGENWEDEERSGYMKKLRDRHWSIKKLKEELGELLAERLLADDNSLIDGTLTDQTGAEFDAKLLVIEARQKQ